MSESNGARITPLEMLLVIAVGALIVGQPPKRREAVLARINSAVGDPTVVPIGDGEALRMAGPLRDLFERLLPSWFAP